MKYWVLAISLFLVGCGGESGDADEASAETAGAEIADTLNDAQDAAADVEVLLDEAKTDIDTAIEEAEEAIED
jgi:hypothetical protein